VTFQISVDDTHFELVFIAINNSNVVGQVLLFTLVKVLPIPVN